MGIPPLIQGHTYAREAGVSDAARLYAQCRSETQSVRTEGYEQLGRLLYRMLWGRVSGDARLEHIAADACQETLVTVWRAIASDRGPDSPDSFIAWSARIAVNKVIDMRRRLEPSGRARATRRVGLSRQVRLDAPETADQGDLADRIADPGAGDTDEQASRGELHEALQQIGGMAAVSEASKVVLLKGYLEGWTDDELAERLGTTRGNVHVIRCRDLTCLRREDDFMGMLRIAAGCPPCKG